MRILLIILFTGLLLMLVVAVGTEVVALHRGPVSVPSSSTTPIVVRKAIHTVTPLKTVRRALKEE